MVRLIQESDQQDLMTLLNHDAIVNYFMLLSFYGDLNKLSEVLGVFDDEGLAAVLIIRVTGNAQYYGIRPVDPWILNSILTERNVKGLIAEKQCMRLFIGCDRSMIQSLATVMDLKPADFRFVPCVSEPIKSLNAEDAESIKALYRLCFKGSLSEEQIRRNLREATGRGRAIWQDNLLVAVAQTIFETDSSAILYGVATHPSHRGKGYASLLLNDLLSTLTMENKSVHLLVEDAGAIRLYKKLGFKDRTVIESLSLSNGLEGGLKDCKVD